MHAGHDSDDAPAFFVDSGWGCGRAEDDVRFSSLELAKRKEAPRPMTALTRLMSRPETAPINGNAGLTDTVARLIAIAQELSLEVGVRPGEDRPGDPGTAAKAEATPVQSAKALIACRRLREKLFGKELFSDPAWDILLDLFIAQSEGRDIAIGSACIAAAVPFTSALRWCQMLETRGLLYRVRDPRDGRRVFLRLTDEAFEQVNALMQKTMH
jgi:hypothetical protein